MDQQVAIEVEVDLQERPVLRVVVAGDACGEIEARICPVCRSLVLEGDISRHETYHRGRLHPYQ